MKGHSALLGTGAQYYIKPLEEDKSESNNGRSTV